MRIQSLDPDVVKKLRSDLAISSVAQCAEELVWNSIDSGANCIAVRLNLPFYKIQVIDNGCGIPSDQLAFVGNRYSTSKCHTLQDLQNLQYVGFRGEALASLTEVSSNLMIESRASDSLQTFCKIFTHGKASKPSISINSRPSKGTTVTVFDFMYNRPVRRLSISEAIDVEDTRRLLQSIALVHPQISFSLQNESTGKMCLQFRKCASMFYAFVELFGKDKGKSLKMVEAKFEDYSVSGCISKEAFGSKDYQFLYVNKRLLYKMKLHKLVNDLMNKAFIKKNMDNLTSPSKNQQQYCAFVLDITCGRSKYDAVFEHKRTIVEFTEWEKVTKLLEIVVLDFLRSHNLISSLTDLEEPTVSSSNDFETCNGGFLNLGVDYFKNGLFSHAAKRREDTKDETINDQHPISETYVEIDQNTNLPNVKGNLTPNPSFELTHFSNDISNAKRITLDETPGVINPYEVSSQFPINKNYVCLKKASNASVLDTLKGDTSSVIKNNNVNSSKKQVSIPSSVESQLDIPSRSVFPVQSPVMLTVPCRSTLSQLKNKRGHRTMTLQIKEKFTFSSDKARKFTESIQEITLKVTNKQDVVRNEEQTQFNPLPAVLESNCKNTEEIATFYNACGVQNDQVSESALLLDNKTSRITSKYKFLDDTHLSTFKRLRFSKKPKKATNLVENSSDCISTDSERSETFPLLPTWEISKSNTSSPDVFGTLKTQCISDLKSLVNKNQSFNPSHNIPHDLNNGEIELQEHEKFHSSPSKCVSNSKSHFFEDETSNFFLRSFKSNKRKSNEDILPKDKRNVKELLALNLRQFKKTGKDNIKINLDNSNTTHNNLLNKIKTSTDLIAPNSLLNVINTSTDAQSNQSMLNGNQPNVLNKSFRDKNAYGKFKIINTNKDSGTNLFSASNEKYASLAQRMFQNLDEDINLPEITEIDPVSRFNYPKSKITSQSVTDNHNSLTEYSSIVSLEAKNNSPSENFEIHFKDDSLVDMNKKFISPSTDFNLSPKQILPVYDLSAASQTKTDSQNESMDVSSTMESVLVQEKNNDFSDSCTELPSDSILTIDDTYTKQSNAELENHSSSSVALNTVLKILNENGDFSIPVSPKEIEMFSNNEIQNENIGLHKQNLPSTTDVVSHGNTTTFESSAKVHEDKLSSSTENNTETSLCFESNKEANFFDKLSTRLHKQLSGDEPDRLAHCLSNQPVGVAVKKFKSENCDGAIMDVDSPKCDDNQNEKIEGRWISHVNENTKRIAYIDSITGNSTYVLPEALQENKAPSSTEDLLQGRKKKSHFFLTHDFSPFVQSTLSQKDPSDNDEECELQNELHRYIDNEEVSNWQRKWRNPSEKPSPSDDNIQNMFSAWENPMFDVAPEMNNIEDPKVPVCLPHMYFLNSYRFNSSSLSSSKVIGQVDCKFIACIIQDFSDNNKNRRLLALFDQHAVHERIRLEELTEDLYETKEDRKRIVKSQQVITPLSLSLEPSEVCLLRNYHTHLQDLGIFVYLNEDGNDIKVYSLPVCLVKDGNQLKRKADETCVLLEKIIKEWLSSLMQNRGVSSILPKTLSAVLNSQACRGAVKFGDPLDLSQCEDLMASLAHCNLPFQCAHGRPSIAPVLDLNKLSTLAKKRNPPQLWKLSAQINKQI